MCAEHSLWTSLLFLLGLEGLQGEVEPGVCAGALPRVAYCKIQVLECVVAGNIASLYVLGTFYSVLCLQGPSLLIAHCRFFVFVREDQMWFYMCVFCSWPS